MPRIRLDPDYWKLIFKDELKEHTQADIAKAIGVSQCTVSRKLQTLNFTLPELAKMQKELGVDVEKVVSKF